MLIKAAIIFLCVMVVIGWVGSLFGRKAWWSRLLGRASPRRLDPPCPACGRPRIGRGPCPCGRG